MNKTFIDVLSSIGGFLNIIIKIMTFINNFFNPYFILNDFNHLINLFGITQVDIAYVRRNNLINKKLRQAKKQKKIVSCLQCLNLLKM